MNYDKKLMEEQARQLEEYMYIFDNLCCFEDLAPSKKKKARKKIKKLIKHLKNGEGDKVYDKERYLEYIESKREEFEDY